MDQNDCKTIEDFVKKTGMIESDKAFKTILNSLPKKHAKLKKDLLSKLKESDGGIQAYGATASLLIKLCQIRPDLHIITTTDSDDGNDVVYDNSLRYVNRIKFYIGTKDSSEEIYFNEVFERDVE